MSDPTSVVAPTAESLATEALTRAGLGRRAQQEVFIKRVRQEWIPEIMVDIRQKARLIRGDGLLSGLQTEATTVVVTNQTRFIVPDEYEHDLQMWLLDGDSRDTATGGDAFDVNLSATESISEVNAIGRYILMLSGTSHGQYRQITAYDEGTNTATVSHRWDTQQTPIAGDTYVIITRENKLEQQTTYDAEWDRVNRAPSEPTRFQMYNREVELDLPPQKAYGLRFRYYADPELIDYNDPKWVFLFRKYRRPLILGLMWTAMQDVDDDRAINLEATYTTAVQQLISSELTTDDEAESFALME